MCEELRDDSNVVRYIRPRKVMEDGTVDGSAFRLRPNEERLSVNWMEYFDQVSEDAQVHLIAQLIRMDTDPMDVSRN